MTVSYDLDVARETSHDTKRKSALKPTNASLGSNNAFLGPFSGGEKCVFGAERFWNRTLPFWNRKQIYDGEIPFCGRTRFFLKSKNLLGSKTDFMRPKKAADEKQL